MFTSLSLILLAFFILLYALSSPKNKEKQQELAYEIKQAFQSIGGLFSGPGDDVETGRGRQEKTLEVSSQAEALLSELQGYSETEEGLEEFSYEMTSEELRLQIPTDFTFDAGNIVVSKKAHPFLDKIFEMIVRTENQVRIEGHTDDLSFRNTKYQSNWELSAARAINVLRYFVAKKEVPEHRFSAAGYGEYQPVASNRFSEGRSRNRRITILFIGGLKPLGGSLGTGK